jgi:hypothetical protein
MKNFEKKHEFEANATYFIDILMTYKKNISTSNATYI